MTRLVLYARVSTADQRPEVQLEPLRLYAQARGFELVAEYVDHGVSGAKSSRPGLDRMMADARRRRFDVVAVVKLDRLARSVRHLTAMAGEFEALGVDLVVLDQGLDTSTAAGRLLFNVLGSIAEFERELIVERTRAGIAAAKRRGVRFGPAPSVSKHAQDRIRRLHRLGRSQREIARVLGVSKSTIGRECVRLGLGRDHSPSPESAGPNAASAPTSETISFADMSASS